MTEIKVNETINAPAEQVWDIVRDFSALDEFVEAVASCVTEGSGVGTIRTLVLQDGGEVQERLESLDDEERSLTYSIVAAPLPIQNYMGTMQVHEKDDQHAEFIWSSAFEVQDDAEKEVKEAFKGIYTMGMEGLQKKFFR